MDIQHDSIQSVNLNSSIGNAAKISQFQNGAKTVLTPRPTPKFFSEPQGFSTKKERHGTPRESAPPKPPVKSAPPISRIFPHRPVNKPHQISFRNHRATDNSLVSHHYNEASRELYFDQCFTIVDKLGHGSFGEVYKVESKEDKKLYAIKRSRDRFRGESDRRRKLEEVAKHEKLPKHPNCVRFVKAWEEKQHLYIQTELCKSSLSDYAEQNHNIPETLVWNYLVDLLMAVKHLHDHDLVHMDIKPDNIFISADGLCKLGDFGLVIDLTKPLDKSEAMEGDPQYMAPELLRGQFGSPADVFSLGVTILELASDLDLPRGGELWHELRSGTLPEQFLQGVSSELHRIIRWMMEPDPALRPTVDEVLADPVIRHIWKRRKLHQIKHKICHWLVCLWHMVVRLLLLLWFLIMWPIHKIFPVKYTTPKRDHPDGLHEWDHSFSDDEIFDDGINIHNNSLGHPLDFSSSSEESARDADGFIIPNPVRRAQTTPGFRARGKKQPFTPGSVASSPYFNSASTRSSRGIYSSSPFKLGALQHSFHINESLTPNSSFEKILEDLEDDLPLNRSGIEPKNLMEVFEDHVSSDEEDFKRL